MKQRTPSGARRRTHTSSHPNPSPESAAGRPSRKSQRKRRRGPLPDVEVSVVQSEVDSGVVETRPDGSVVVHRKPAPEDPQESATQLNIPAVTRDMPTEETPIPDASAGDKAEAEVDPASAWFAEGAEGAAAREADGVASIPGAEDALGITITRENRKRLAKIGLFLAACAAVVAFAVWDQTPPATPDVPSPSGDDAVASAGHQRWSIRRPGPQEPPRAAAEVSVSGAAPTPAEARDEAAVAAAVEAPAPVPEGGELSGPTVTPAWEEVARAVDAPVDEPAEEAAPGIAGDADHATSEVVAAVGPSDDEVAPSAGDAPDEPVTALAPATPAGDEEPAAAAGPAVVAEPVAAVGEPAGDEGPEPTTETSVTAEPDEVVAAVAPTEDEPVADEAAEPAADEPAVADEAVEPVAVEPAPVEAREVDVAAAPERVALWPDGFPEDSIPAQVASSLAAEATSDAVDADAIPNDEVAAAPSTSLADEVDDAEVAEGSGGTKTEEPAAEAARVERRRARGRANPSSAEEWFATAQRLEERAPRDALYAYGRAATRGYAPAYKAMARVEARLGDRLGTLTAYRRYLAVRPWADDAPEVQEKILELLDR